MNSERMNNRAQSYRWSYLWLVAGTILLFFWRAPLVWWLAPVFWIRFMRTQPTKRGFFLIWVAGFLVSIPPMYTILSSVMPTPLPVFLIINAVFALMNTAIPYLVDRLLAPRLKGLTATLVFPLMMTTVSYIAAKANPMGSIGGTAYFQHSNLALVQLLSITGMWGIVFVVNWFGSFINYVWEHGLIWREIRRNCLIYGAVMLAVLLYGGIRLAYAPQPTDTVRVHGFTAVDMRLDMNPRIQEARDQGWEAFRQLSLELQDLYLEGTQREAQAGAQIVHWPEMAVRLAGEDEDDFIARAKEVVQSEQIYLVMAYSVSYQDNSPWENKLVILNPAGDIILEHKKYSLVMLERTNGGDGILRTAETSFGTLSGIICNDTYHEEIVAQAGQNGTDILFSPTLGYRQTDPLQAHMAMYRAIENGVTHIREADNGLSIVVDPYGRIVSSMDHWTANMRVMVAQAPIQSAFTIYPYIGDSFAWLAIAGLLAIVIPVMIQNRKAKRNVAESTEH